MYCMKRILQVVGGMNRAGAETMLINLYKTIDRSKFQFDFVYFTSEMCDYDDDILELGGRIFRITTSNMFLKMYQLYKILRKYGSYSALHSHTNYNSFTYHIPALLAGVKNRITHSHCSNSLYTKSITGRAYLRVSEKLNHLFSSRFIACGRDAGQFLFPKVDLSEIIILPNALPLENYLNPNFKDYSSIRDAFSVSSSTPLIIQIGRLNEVKNFEFTIDFAAYLKKQGREYQFAFIGTGELLGKLKNKVNDLDLTDCIHFTGVREDIPQILNEASCLIMPSLFEGFPVVLVEAQAAGTACLLSDTIPKDVDLGLGLIQTCSLKASYNDWNGALDCALAKKGVSKNRIKEVLTDKGFSVEKSVRKLELIYDE